MAYVDDERLRNKWNAQKMQTKGLQDYAAGKEAIDKKYSTGNTGLSGLLSGIIKDAKAIGSTISDTGSVIGSLWNQDQAQRNLATAQEKSKNDLDAIAQKYGYKNKDEAYDRGDGPEEMWKEFQDSTLGTRKKVEDISNTYKNSADYKRVQDMKQSEYGANALRTMKTLKDIMLPGASLINGAVDGSIDALADNLERADGTLLDIEAGLSGGKIKSAANTGLDLGQTLKDMAVGGLAGAAGSAAAGRVGNATSGIGSRLLNNKLATSGIGRGAIAGAAGGAVGGGLGAALNGGDVLGSTLQGATSGAATGGVMGGLSSGARKLGTKATDAMGITDNLQNLRSKFMYDPNDPGNGFFGRKEVAQTPETTAQTQEPTQIVEKTIQNQPEGSDFDNRTLTGRAAESLKRTGKYLEGMQAALNKADKKKIGVKDTGGFIDGVRKKTGISNLADQAEFARNITGGADSVLDTMQKRALAYDANGKPFYVDTSDVYNDIDTVLKNAKVTSSTLGGRNQRDKFVQDLQDDIMDANGDLLGLASSWHESAATFRKSDAAGAKQKAKVYEAMARKLEDASYSKIPQENVDAMFSASIDELRNRANNATNTQAKKAYAQAADKLEATPRTIKDFRSFKEDFVKVNKIYDKVLENENGGAVRMARGIRGTANAVKDALIEKPLYWAANKVGAGLSTAGDAISGTRAATATTTPTQATPLSLPEQNMYGILGTRIGTNEGQESTNQTIKNREFNNLEEQLSNTMSEAQALANAPVSSSYAQQTLSPMQEQLSNIVGAMNNAMAAGDIKAYNELAKMYSTAYSIYKNQAAIMGEDEGGTSNLSTAEKNQLAKFESAGTALDQLESLYKKAGGGQGVIGGNIANFLGGLGLNSDVNTYNQLAQGLINQIGAAIGKTDSLNTEGEVQRALSLVPKITDDNQTAMNKLSTLRQLLQQNTNSYNQLYGA